MIVLCNKLRLKYFDNRNIRYIFIFQNIISQLSVNIKLFPILETIKKTDVHLILSVRRYLSLYYMYRVMQ